VSAAAEGAIDVDAIRAAHQRFHRLVQEHGYMLELAHGGP
jgi:hypothetical protein